MNELQFFQSVVGKPLKHKMWKCGTVFFPCETVTDGIGKLLMKGIEVDTYGTRSPASFGIYNGGENFWEITTFETLMKAEHTQCMHKRAYKNVISAAMKFMYCPDCKKDLGDCL